MDSVALLTSAQVAVRRVNEAIAARDEAAILASLRAPGLGLLGVVDANSNCYLKHFISFRDHKVQVSGSESLRQGRTLVCVCLPRALILDAGDGVCV